jgi:hypothetical protein
MLETRRHNAVRPLTLGLLSLHGHQVSSCSGLGPIPNQPAERKTARILFVLLRAAMLPTLPLQLSLRNRALAGKFFQQSITSMSRAISRIAFSISCRMNGSGSITTSSLAKFLTSFFLSRKDLAKNQRMLKLWPNNAATATVRRLSCVWDLHFHR